MYLFHGEVVATIAVQQAQAAAVKLRTNGVDFTLDWEQDMSHVINPHDKPRLGAPALLCATALLG